MSIKVTDGLFRLETAETSYVFRVNEMGHLEQIHYGRKLPEGDIESLRHKHELTHGSAVLYDEEKDSSYCLEEIPLEWSGVGKGDFRVTPIEVKLPDNSFTCDFVFENYSLQSGAPAMHTLPSAAGNGAETLVVTLKDKAFSVYADLYYSVYEAENVITRRCVLRSDEEGTVLIKKIMSYSIDLPDRNYTVITLSGGWISEANTIERRLETGMLVNESTSFSQHRNNPAVALVANGATEETGDVYGFNLIYGGNHQTSVELSPVGLVRVTGGLNPYCFLWELHKGESFETPEAVLTYSMNGKTGMSQNFHAFVQNQVVRGEWQKKERPILINNWEAHFFQFRQNSLLRLAKRGKRLGCELFVLDDGWFGDRNTDTAGLGDYTVNRKKLPDGLEGLSQRINRCGMKFGLWFEPENVNDNSDLYRAHPEWAIQRPNRKASLGRHQKMLNLTMPEVRDYIVENVTQILDHCYISYVKWDMNRKISDFEDGTFLHRYMIGYYDVLSRIFRERPWILLEGCASGGGRFDLGHLCFAQQIWASDDTDPVERLKIQGGLSLFYPISTMGAHLSMAPHQQTLRDTPLFTRFAVAAFGAFGLELDPSDLKPVERKTVASLLEQYRRIRKTCQFGRFSRIETGNRNIVQWQAQDEEKTVILRVKTMVPAAQKNDYLTVTGLKPDALYHLKEIGNPLFLHRFGGLMKHILPIKLKPNGFILRTVDKYMKMDDFAESYTASGAQLMAGIRLHRSFIGTGFSDKMHMQGDYSAILIEIAEEK